MAGSASQIARAKIVGPGALVHAGEAGFERIDAGGLPVQGGQQLPVIGVELLQDGQVAGVDRGP